VSASEYGNRAAALAGEILRTVVGSGVHGIAVEGTDDTDEMGVYIEPPEAVFGLQAPLPHYVHRTQPEGHPSGPGDVDLVMYSLRKYLHLAAKGNPTVLLPLFAPEDAVLTATKLGRELREMRSKFLSQQAGRRFLGYMHGQRERIVSGRKLPNRPELVAEHGYDTKYAAHALRLAYEGLEVVRDGTLTLPMPPTERDHVLRVKRGELPLGSVLGSISTLSIEIENRLDNRMTSLPARPDLDALTKWSVRAHARAWREHLDWR
jgi:uncharacterized protein